MAWRGRTVAVALALGLLAGACGGSDDDDADDGTVRTTGAEVTFTYAEPVADATELAGAVKERLTPLGIDVDDIDTDTPGELTVALADEDDQELATDLLAQQGVVRVRPVLALTPGAPVDVPITPAVGDLADQEAVLPERDRTGRVTSIFRLGPAVVDGGIESAEVERFEDDWQILLTLFEAAAAEFNEGAAQCFSQDLDCPTGRLAIVVDGTVVTAPTVNQPRYERDQIAISGLDEEPAKRLAVVLSTGPLPVTLVAPS